MEKKKELEKTKADLETKLAAADKDLAEVRGALVLAQEEVVEIEANLTATQAKLAGVRAEAESVIDTLKTKGEKRYRAATLTGLRGKFDAIDTELKEKGYATALPDGAVIAAAQPANQEEAEMPVEDLTRGQLNMAIAAVGRKKFYEGFQLALAVFMSHKAEILGPEKTEEPDTLTAKVKGL